MAIMTVQKNKRISTNLMLIEIEYYKGDVILTGKARSAAVLKRQISETEQLYDRETDNFTKLLYGRFGWTRIQTDVPPDYVYDRDTGIFREVRR